MQDLDRAENDKNTGFDPQALTTPVARAAQNDYVRKIVEKIRASENILVVLSKSPSIDEVSAAIALTMYLDGIQKHTTAVYSGKIPKELEFLKPKEMFETNTATLQDFVISLDKNKADHLRYKLEGDEVRIYITPYRTIITEKDLSFKRGDYNVDFVVAIGVKSADDIDAAVTDKDAIMRAASTVNITCEGAGSFGEIEWNNPAASSVCEMMTELIMALDEHGARLDRDVATALLTGIVATTERFSNGRTNAETLTLAAKLMEMGADQQLISANVMKNAVIENPAKQVAQKLEMPPNLPEPAKMETAHEGGGGAAGGAGAMPGGAGAAAGGAAGGAAAGAAAGVAAGAAPTMTAKQEEAMNSTGARTAASIPLDLSSAVVKPIVGAAPKKPETPKIESKISMPEPQAVAPIVVQADALNQAGAPGQAVVLNQAGASGQAVVLNQAGASGQAVVPPVVVVNQATPGSGFTQRGKSLMAPTESTKVDYGAMIDAAIAENDSAASANASNQDMMIASGTGESVAIAGESGAAIAGEPVAKPEMVLPTPPPPPSQDGILPPPTA